MAPSWGNYLYQNLLPNLQNTDWLLNLNNGGNDGSGNAQVPPGPTATGAAAGAGSDLFPTWPTNTNSVGGQAAQPLMGQPGPSNYYMNYYGGSIAPSLLAPSTNGSGSMSSNGGGVGTPNISPSLDLVDKIVASPSPLGGSPGLLARNASTSSRRRRSMDSDAEGEIDPEAETRSQHSHHSEHDSVHDHDEGVERDGMIWGMKVDEYRALSARERKRVRNRISARTFRAKRKEHLSSLESTLGAKDLEIKLAHEENMRLRRQLAELKRRLSKYEAAPVF